MPLNKLFSSTGGSENSYFPGMETQKTSKEPLAITCNVAKRQEKVPWAGTKKKYEGNTRSFLLWEATDWEL